MGRYVRWKKFTFSLFGMKMYDKYQVGAKLCQNAGFNISSE